VTAPRVAASPPAGWVATEIERPRIAESSGAAFTAWNALGGSEGDARFVAGCVATPIPGWVEDMRPAVEGRTVALAGAVAGKIAGTPIDARPGEAGVLDLRAANDLNGPVIGHARAFVGFDASRVFTCFATCVSRQGPSRGCDRAVVESRLEGSLPPPTPGLALRSVTWAVHQPRPATIVGLGVIAIASILAVVLRRRPRTRS
jgi:hypothetical protein